MVLLVECCDRITGPLGQSGMHGGWEATFNDDVSAGRCSFVDGNAGEHVEPVTARQVAGQHRVARDGQPGCGVEEVGEDVDVVDGGGRAAGSGLGDAGSDVGLVDPVAGGGDADVPAVAGFQTPPQNPTDRAWLP